MFLSNIYQLILKMLEFFEMHKNGNNANIIYDYITSFKSQSYKQMPSYQRLSTVTWHLLVRLRLKARYIVMPYWF